MKSIRGLAALCLFTIAGAAMAGPLDPPAGPVGPTMKTLQQTEPRTPIGPQTTPGDADATPSVYRITQPGSYYLTGNIAGEAGKIGIEIASSDVTLDLSGFALEGVAGSAAGIRANSGCYSVSVRNGVVRGWGGIGVDLSYGRSNRIADVTATHNSSVGIAAGTDAVVTGCIARNNTATGIGVSSGSTIRDCVANDNGAYGIYVGDSGSISGCTARSNDDTGFYGSATTSFIGCTAVQNQQGGFVSGYGCTFTACTARDNTGLGFWVNDGGNAVNCSAFGNTSDGFNVWAGSISSCQASYNGRDGIRLDAGSSSATGNTCKGNGTQEPGAGVRAVAVSCRVDSNQAVENDYGIVATTDCIVVRNSARGNSSGNYSFPGGSEYGQILTNPGSGFASTNPWANFSY